MVRNRKQEYSAASPSECFHILSYETKQTELKGLSDPSACGVNWNGQIIDVFNHTCCFFLSACRTRPSPAEEPTAGSTEEPRDGTPSSWMTDSPELQEPENMPGLGDEELPHLLLPDSLSQLEEFGRHKRLRKAHRGHGRPRLFSDLWVRIGDRWVCVLTGTESPCFNFFCTLNSSFPVFPVCPQKLFSATKCEDYQWLCNSGSATDTSGAAQTAGRPTHPVAPVPSLSRSARGQLGPHGSFSQRTPAGDGFSLDVVRLVLLLLTKRMQTGRKELQDEPRGLLSLSCRKRTATFHVDSYLKMSGINSRPWYKQQRGCDGVCDLHTSPRPSRIARGQQNLWRACEVESST